MINITTILSHYKHHPPSTFSRGAEGALPQLPGRTRLVFVQAHRRRRQGLQWDMAGEAERLGQFLPPKRCHGKLPNPKKGWKIAMRPKCHQPNSFRKMGGMYQTWWTSLESIVCCTIKSRKSKHEPFPVCDNLSSPERRLLLLLHGRSVSRRVTGWRWQKTMCFLRRWRSGERAWNIPLNPSESYKFEGFFMKFALAWLVKLKIVERFLLPKPSGKIQPGAPLDGSSKLEVQPSDPVRKKHLKTHHDWPQT